MFATLLPALLVVAVGTLTPPQDALTLARQLRDSGKFVEAIRVLDDRLVENPDDAEAARLRAQTLYWIKDLARARSSYAEALKRHPNDERLCVEYARMLAETDDRRGALELLASLERSGRASPDGHALLGTILYWQGDYSAAKRHFIRALNVDPTNREAARQLAEIGQLSSPWLRVEPTFWRDDQPLKRQGVAIEAGWFLTPLFSISARSTPMRHSTTTVQTSWSNEVELSHYAPGARLESRLAAGVVRRPRSMPDVAWTGRADFGVRATPYLTVHGGLERAPYLNTATSLGTSINTTMARGIVQLNHRRGWIGEASIQRQTYPDSNAIRTAYAWLMAPLANGTRGRLQAGFAFAASDADEDRFVLAHPHQPFPPSDPRYDFSGIYDPYYTPQRLATHSVIAAITAGGSGPVLRAGGSYALRANEDATSFQAIAGQVTPVVGRRSYTPWTLHGSLDIPAGRALTFVVGAESGRTAYYHWTTVRVQFAFRFLPPNADRAKP